MLNAERLVDVALDPELDPALYALLGGPSGAAARFRSRPVLDGITDELAAVFAWMRHYVIMGYPDQTDLAPVEARLRDDPRFGYVSQPPRGSFAATPNDTYFSKPVGPPTPYWLEDYQYAATAIPGVNLAGAWDSTTGWAVLAIADGGPPVKAGSGPTAHLLYDIDHFDLQRVVAYRHSWEFLGTEVPGAGSPRRQLKDLGFNPHGTHVLGIAAANTDNAAGVAGACWHCTVNYAQVEPAYETVLAFESLGYSGAQAINFSGGVPYASGLPCSAFGYAPPAADLCPILMLLNELEVSVAAASGNHLQGALQFPASDDLVIGVGGSDSFFMFWDERNRSVDPWDFCTAPYTGCTDYSGVVAGGASPYYECGSNQGGGQDFLAPARKIISTLPYGAALGAPLIVHPQHDLCIDDSFSGANDGIGYCTGTSMAAPLVTGMIGLVLSANPLLSRADVYDALRSNSSAPGYSTISGWGVPDAEAAVDWARGEVACATVAVRATPMFVLHNWSDRDRLYTTRPQAASGALLGNFLADPPDTDCWLVGPCPSPSPTETARPYVSGLSGETSAVAAFTEFRTHKPNPGFIPHAAFWMLTSDKTDIPGAVVRPLYRLSFVEECDWRDHIYTTESFGIDTLSQTDYCPSLTGTQSFHYDAIEGYLFRECPQGFGCNNVNDPSELQALYRRWSSTDEMSALILHSQLGLPQFASYNNCTPPNQCDPFGGTADGFLGYVIPNIDSDGDTLPDAFERLLGTNPLLADSDGDGLADGVEYPVAGLQGAHDPLRLPENPCHVEEHGP